MCLNPNLVSDVGFVACRECWQCRERKIDDWVGRNIAESKTAKAAHVVTLTYGEDRSTGDIDHLRASVLTYSDVQKYLKLLRVNGYPVRYFAVGEYGSKKGRAHWHIVLYWQGKIPDHKLRENFNERHWPHGWSYWDKATPEAVRYACKYILKDTGDDARQGYGPMPSKVPPLGDAYFRQLAAKYVQAGLAPQDLYYSFPDVRRVPHGTRAKTAKGFRDAAKPVQFLLSGKSAENYVRYYMEEWRRQHGTEPPASPLVYGWYDDGRDMTSHDKKTWAQEQLEQFKPLRAFSGYVPVPQVKPRGFTDPVFSEKLNCYVTRCPTFGQRLMYGTSDEGVIGWLEKGSLTALPLEALAKPKREHRITCQEARDGERY